MKLMSLSEKIMNFMKFKRIICKEKTEFFLMIGKMIITKKVN
jgi:hypothetical protein